MRRVAPPPPLACEVCYAPVPRHLGRSRCDKHVFPYATIAEQKSAERARLESQIRLRECPECGKPTFRQVGVCSQCDKDVPPLVTTHVPNHAPHRKRFKKERPVKRPPVRRPPKWNGAIVPELARELANTPQPEPKTPHQAGNRCVKGKDVTLQRPARDAALKAVRTPGEWVAIAEYRHPNRVKAAVWYLRHKVTQDLPVGEWEFRRSPLRDISHVAAVEARYNPS